jgi:hypothetical protein
MPELTVQSVFQNGQQFIIVGGKRHRVNVDGSITPSESITEKVQCYPEMLWQLVTAKAPFFKIMTTLQNLADVPEWLRARAKIIRR